jgi:2-dehydro-3-deoxyglucarate aldolase/4-hydroxy-2-oxoheptanedioate aldolase
MAEQSGLNRLWNTADSADLFRQRLRGDGVCLGTCVTFTDPTITETLATVLDFVWIDMEHNALSLEAVQGHIMATRGSQTTALVRVAWNDPVLIKPVLDIGAAGVIVPLIRTADDAKHAVAACKYPPAGVRGFGPRRASRYGTVGGPEYCRRANESVVVIVQIEHIDAVRNIHEILQVPGVTTIVIGSQDLAGSLGHIGQPRHPEVLAAIDTVIDAASKAGMPLGMALGDTPTVLRQWRAKGVKWFAVGVDYWLLQRAADEICRAIRDGNPTL